MGIQLNPKAVNQISKGTVLYSENDEITSIDILLKGKVSAVNAGSRIVLPAGSFLGAVDSYTGHYIAEYTAEEASMIYSFPASGSETVEKILLENKDYPGLFMISQLRRLSAAGDLWREICNQADELYSFAKQFKKWFQIFGGRYGCECPAIPVLDKLLPFEWEGEADSRKVQYYKECTTVPQDIQKTYYSYCMGMALCQSEEISALVSELSQACAEGTAYIAGLLTGIADDRGSCLLHAAEGLLSSVRAAGGSEQEVLERVEKTIHTVVETELFLNTKTGYQSGHAKKAAEEIRGSLKQYLSTDGKIGSEGPGNDKLKAALEEMRGSLNKLLAYSGMKEESTARMKKCLAEFSAMKDKSATDDTARKLRRDITELYYDLYETVFIKAYKDKSASRLVDMFLNYGFLDETLLDKEQMIQLYFMQDPSRESTGRLPIYTIRRWLTEIYEMKKEPSKNEFDLDYMENLRDMKRTMSMTQAQEKDYIENPENRLRYEIKNMLRYNNRTVSGQISIYVPILYRELFPGDISRFCIDAARIEEAFDYLEAIDFSVFYRETLYTNEEKGVKREYIQKYVLPDLILLPTCGQNSIMWQEITGRRRDTPGRFLLPSFTEYPLRDMLTKVFGRFRWELCRSIQGVSWNDIKVKSLTSEYCDYIQFYRKNRDLSEEWKGKIKSQIQKAKNNSREFFVLDYEQWIRYESQGAMRLNKVSREILATYCPFVKEVRDGLLKQGNYEEAMLRYNREMQRTVKEFELRLHHLQQENVEITPELKETLEYYRNN